MQSWSEREIEADPLAMGQTHIANYIEIMRQMAEFERADVERRLKEMQDGFERRLLEVERQSAEVRREIAFQSSPMTHCFVVKSKGEIPELLQDSPKYIEYSSYEKVEKLLAEYVSNGYTPDTSELKQYLLDISADERFELLKKQDRFGDTALQQAAERGHTKMMRCLLEMVEPKKRYELLKIQGEWCETPLHLAASRGRTKVMRCMLELVEPENQIQLLDIPDDDNDTALDVAKGEKTVQLIRQYRESAEREIAATRKLYALPVLFAFSADKMSPRGYLSYVHNNLSLEEQESLMSDEKQRRNTFLLNWPHDGNLFGVKMAQAGFYCVDDYDRVQCAFCRGSLHKWKAEDNAMTEHARLFPFCRFVKGLECGNKEYKNDLLLAGTPGGRKSGDEPFEEHLRWFPDCSYLLQLKGEKYIDEVHARTEDNKKTTSLVPDSLKWIFNPSLHGISSAVPPPPSYLTDVLCYVVGGPPDTPNPPSLDLLQQLAAMSQQEYRDAIRNDLSPFQLHWLMSMEMQRRKTFLDDWPHAGNLSGEQMAQAGFYHSGGYDSVRCVFCGVVIHSWDVNDDPMAEHTKWFPLCWFVQGLAGGNMECPSGPPSDGVLSAPVQKGPAVVAAHAANSI